MDFFQVDGVMFFTDVLEELNMNFYVQYKLMVIVYGGYNTAQIMQLPNRQLLNAHFHVF